MMGWTKIQGALKEKGLGVGGSQFSVRKILLGPQFIISLEHCWTLPNRVLILWPKSYYFKKKKQLSGNEIFKSLQRLWEKNVVGLMDIIIMELYHHLILPCKSVLKKSLPLPFPCPLCVCLCLSLRQMHPIKVSSREGKKY